MATNLSITAANVGIGDLSTTIRAGTMGEAVTHAQPLYRASTNKFLVGDANAAADDSTSAEITALALHAGSGDNAIVAIVTRGLVNLGATLVVGAAYYLSPDKGGICREDQLTTGCWVTYLGVARTTALLDFDPRPQRVKIP